jgi:hypothetical protein
VSRPSTHPGGAARLRAGLLACALAAVLPPPAASAAQSDKPDTAAKKPVRVYTNEDLERVHPFAAQTGGSSQPAVVPDGGEADRSGQRSERSRRRGASARSDEPDSRGRGEAWWRDEAARVRERVRALEERAAALQAKLRERSRETPVYGRRGSSARAADLETLQASLAALERRIRATLDDLEERARRDGALPGWLR